MRKCISLITSIAIISTLLIGCSNVHPWIEQRLEMLDELTATEKEENLEISQNIVKCFNETNKQGLKSLLCIKTQNLSDIDEQIQALFDLIDGNIVSFDEEVVTGYEGKSASDGTTTKLDRAWSIKDITTDLGEIYSIYIRMNMIYKEDKDREGITEMIVSNSSDEEVIIGYSWPDYYTVGSQLSYKVISALSENDIDSLKATMCENALKIENIDAQIQSAFNFFEGQATFGKVGENDGNELYNGAYDYHTTVIEDEIVENHEPIRTYLTVSNKNIITDADEIYTMEFYAYHLYTGNEDYEGISQMKIINDDGEKIIIGEKLN